MIFSVQTVNLRTLRICYLAIAVLLARAVLVNAQDDRAQYPEFLSKAYFGLSVGSITYPFTNQHLPSIYRAGEVRVPHLAPRLTLLGYRFTDNLSARITYMRPVNWPAFANINGDRADHSMWMNVGGLTLKARTTPGKRKPSFYGESGLGLITRRGFDVGGKPAVKSVSYAGVLLGGGVELPLNDSWAIDTNVVWAPGKKSVQQPHTLFAGSGFVYQMRRLPQDRVDRNRNGGYVFPKNLVQVAVTSNSVGFGVNHFVSEGAVPVFWGGGVEVRRGVAVNLQRNVFHTRRIFSFDLGTSFGLWESSQLRQRFSTVSVYPLMRFTAIRTDAADVYMNYSIAGPTFISRASIDQANTGRNFTFRDYLGLGVYAGRAKKWNAELNIGHFSNGNIFPDNAGIKIPLTLYLGYAF